MTTENNEDQNQENSNSNENAENKESSAWQKEKEELEQRLNGTKANLDKAFEARDAAIKKAAELEQKLKEAEIERLKNEGKVKEALELQLQEEKARREALEKRNTELSRDVEVRAALSGLDFRNERASQLAYKEIVADLVRDESGVWKHKSGKSIEDFVKAFAADEDQSFLFKVKHNNGAGSNGSPRGGSGDPTQGKKSLFEMSQEEVLKLAREGKL